MTDHIAGHKIQDMKLHAVVGVFAGFTFFTARAYARAVLGVVILSVRLSVYHTRGL